MLTGAQENKMLGPWRSRERVVRDGRLVYPVGAPIPREEAVRQGIISEEPESKKDSLESLLREDVVQILAKRGIHSLEMLLALSDEEILSVPGIGPATLKRLRAG